MIRLLFPVLFCGFLLAGLPTALKAQFLNPDSADRIFLINLCYGGYQPGGDMAQRFGFTNITGGEVGYKFKNGLYMTGGMMFLFGRDVHEPNHMDNLKYNGSIILNFNGSPAEIRTWERGYTVPVRVGWIFPRLDPFRANANSGPFLEIGAQFIQHKIRIEDIGNQVPSLARVFRPGYDRLTNGIGMMQSVGYRYYSTGKLINFFVSLDLMQNFTESRRDVQYDVNNWNPKPRTDILAGFRVGWTIPIYRVSKSTFYYF